MELFSVVGYFHYLLTNSYKWGFLWKVYGMIWLGFRPFFYATFILRIENTFKGSVYELAAFKMRALWSLVAVESILCFFLAVLSIRAFNRLYYKVFLASAFLELITQSTLVFIFVHGIAMLATNEARREWSRMSKESSSMHSEQKAKENAEESLSRSVEKGSDSKGLELTVIEDERKIDADGDPISSAPHRIGADGVGGTSVALKSKKKSRTEALKTQPSIGTVTRLGGNGRMLHAAIRTALLSVISLGTSFIMILLWLPLSQLFFEKKSPHRVWVDNLFVIDSLINFICIVFMFSFSKDWYDRLCGDEKNGLHGCATKLATKALFSPIDAETEVEPEEATLQS
jgi:hypothetical protein